MSDDRSLELGETRPSGDGEGGEPRLLDVDEAAAELVGQTLDGKYLLEKLLGVGGMGAVYRAYHVGIGSDVAIKVLFAQGEGVRRRESLARFRREAQAAGSISHPNIVRVYDIGETDDGLSYLVMDLVEGRSLAEIVEDEAPLDEGRAVDLVEQVLLALEAAHEQGIVHRDVKPENVMVTVGPDGLERARVLDFGISKVRDIDGEGVGLTQTGTILGTPLYMAPEQARGERDLDLRLDLYAVGTMLYLMLSGQPPYEAENYNALLVKIVSGSPPPLPTVVVGIDPHLVAVVEKAMARDRDHRFSSAREVIEALRGRASFEAPPAVPAAARTKDAEAEGREAAAVPRRPRAAPSRRAVLVGGLLLVVAAVAAAAWLTSRGGETGRAAPPPEPVPRRAEVPRPVSAPDPPPPPSPPREVAVHITTEPADARVTVGGLAVEDPSDARLLRAEGERVVVRVEAPGHEPVERSFPRDRDVVAHIVLARQADSPRRPEPRSRGRKNRGNFRYGLE